jgi:hypothetical protein
MKQVLLRRVGVGLALIVLFSLLYVQLSSDACPIHDRPTAHAGSSTVACRGPLCLCFLHAYCPPAVSWMLEGALTVALSRDFPAGPVFRFVFLEIYHPPRASRLA